MNRAPTIQCTVCTIWESRSSRTCAIFGVPDWLNGFQDAAFPVHFAQYARVFAQRYPWVRHFTAVNEIFICASSSALRGWWNECVASDTAFVTAMRNLRMANELAVEAILSVRPDAHSHKTISALAVGRPTLGSGTLT